MTRIGIPTVLKNTFEVFFKHLGMLLVFAMITGAVGAVLTTWLGERMGDQILGLMDPVERSSSQQVTLIAHVLSQQFVDCFWSGIIGAWCAASTIYLWVARERGIAVSTYDAVNYGLNRLPRVAKAHFKAFALIALGNILIVPGILMGLQYAYVDAIATLDVEEKDPLARSRRLTLSRRGMLFRFFCVFLLWWVPYQVVGALWAQGQGPGVVALMGFVNQIVLILIDLSMVQFYLDMFRTAESAPTTR